MMTKYILITIFSILSLIACSSENKNASVQEQASGKLEISQSWARPASKGANCAAYLSIYNNTAASDTLLGIQSDLTDKAEIHESYTTEEGLSGMRPAGKLFIAAGDSLILKPGGLHIMLMNVSKNLSQRDSLQLWLEFAQSGLKKVSVPVHE